MWKRHVESYWVLSLKASHWNYQPLQGWIYFRKYKTTFTFSIFNIDGRGRWYHSPLEFRARYLIIISATVDDERYSSGFPEIFRSQHQRVNRDLFIHQHKICLVKDKQNHRQEQTMNISPTHKYAPMYYISLYILVKASEELTRILYQSVWKYRLIYGSLDHTTLNRHFKKGVTNAQYYLLLALCHIRHFQLNMIVEVCDVHCPPIL